jgi:hypothetical protein
MDRQTGSIKLYDLNYENFMHTKMDIDKGYYTNVEGDGLSDELRENMHTLQIRLKVLI